MWIDLSENCSVYFFHKNFVNFMFDAIEKQSFMNISYY